MRLLKVFLLVVSLTVLLLLSVDTYAEGTGYRSFNPTTAKDGEGYNIPSGGVSDDLPEFVMPAKEAEGKRYLEASRFMRGQWDHYNLDGSFTMINYGSDPSDVTTWSKTVYAKDYGLTKFTGWTKVTGSKFGAKSGKQYSYIGSDGNPHFSGDLGKLGWLSTGTGWWYLENNEYWRNNWDFWREGNWGGSGEVDVVVSADGKSAVVTRKVIFGSTGYVNYPLYHPESAQDENDLGGPGHKEWQGRFGGSKTPYNTDLSSAVRNDNVEHRLYGVGEKIYFFGVKTPPPPPTITTIIPDKDKPGDDPGGGEPGGGGPGPGGGGPGPDGGDPDPGDEPWYKLINDTDRIRIKSGYGLPISVDLIGFNSASSKYYQNLTFKKDISKVEIVSDPFNIPGDLKRLEAVKYEQTANGDFVRFALKNNPSSIYKNRRVYIPIMQDNSPGGPDDADYQSKWYKIVLHFEVYGEYDMRYSDTDPWVHIAPATPLPIPDRTIYVYVKGSMFEDYQPSISR